jgi:hypothetical protein
MPRPKMNPDQEIVDIHFRLPLELKVKIEDRAAKNCRSLNQEVVWMLQEAVTLYEQESSPKDGQ